MGHWFLLFFIFVEEFSDVTVLFTFRSSFNTQFLKVSRRLGISSVSNRERPSSRTSSATPATLLSRTQTTNYVLLTSNCRSSPIYLFFTILLFTQSLFCKGFLLFVEGQRLLGTPYVPVTFPTINPFVCTCAYS